MDEVAPRPQSPKTERALELGPHGPLRGSFPVEKLGAAPLQRLVI